MAVQPSQPSVTRSTAYITRSRHILFVLCMLCVLDHMRVPAGGLQETETARQDTHCCVFNVSLSIAAEPNVTAVVHAVEYNQSNVSSRSVIFPDVQNLHRPKVKAHRVYVKRLLTYSGAEHGRTSLGMSSKSYKETRFVYFVYFCRAMLCKRGLTIMWCLSVRPSVTFETNRHINNFFTGG